MQITDIEGQISVNSSSPKDQFAYVGGNAVNSFDPEGLQALPARVQQHNRLNDPNSQFNREFGREAFPDPTASVRGLVNDKPMCRTVCPNEGNSCKPTPSGALPSSREGCYEVCASGPFVDVSNPTAPQPQMSGQRSASEGEWLRLLGILRGGR